MIERILSLFRRRQPDDVAQEILEEIKQHLARRQSEIEKQRRVS
jgi:hypothetical protein